MCRSCGTRREVWFDDDDRPLDPPPFEPDFEVCPGCKSIEEARAELDDPVRARGVRIYLRPFSDEPLAEVM